MLRLRCFGRIYQIDMAGVPAPAPTLEEALGQGPEAAELRHMTQAHQAHWRITQLKGEDAIGVGEGITAAMRMMHLCAILSHGLPDFAPLGALWENSAALCDWRAFEAGVEGTYRAIEQFNQGAEKAADHLPAKLWVGLEARDQDAGGWARTRGLEQFGGYEMEMTMAGWDYQQSAAYLMMAVRYLLREGSIQVGEFIGLGEGFLPVYFRLRPRTAPLTEARLFALEPAPAGGGMGQR
ncbi:hypothetical protein MAIT1_02055 [Magnetofaba australis IT-1]|uniref:Uncharacterized protein n=2 Tax=Magnetofaba TaxID=1472292 RepID=A0A1Y2K4Q8_9PROT|nr:hypothetical protein MAIT1_02055 [Magnetofaba australis IT-1]